MEEKAKARNVDDQLHAIWSVPLSHHTYWPLMFSSAVKVLFCSEQCSASIATGNGVLSDGEGRKRFLSPRHSSPRLTFYSARHRNLYQVR